VVKQLGFRTPKAQEVVRNDIDHHSSKQILAASLKAMSHELIMSYFKKCQLENKTPSSEDFRYFIENDVHNDLYLFCRRHLLTRLFAEITSSQIIVVFKLKQTEHIYKSVGRKISRMEQIKPKNSAIKPSSTLSVPYMKIHGEYGLPATRCQRSCILNNRIRD